MRVPSMAVGLFAAAAIAFSCALPSIAASEPSGGSDPMIVGGDPASETYSFMASMQSRGGGTLRCGAALIRPQWLVTAGHCLDGTTPAQYQFRVGTTDRTTGGELALADRFIVHPDFNQVGAVRNDIGLVHLSRPVTAKPVVVVASSPPVGTVTRIIGWGSTCPARSCAPYPVSLRQLDTSVVDDAKCQGITGSEEICTDNPGGGKGACFGDSGGPEIVSVAGEWQLVGHTSRLGGTDPHCAVDPSIYVDDNAYLGWISQHIGG